MYKFSKLENLQHQSGSQELLELRIKRAEVSAGHDIQIYCVLCTYSGQTVTRNNKLIFQSGAFEKHPDNQI